MDGIGRDGVSGIDNGTAPIMQSQMMSNGGVGRAVCGMKKWKLISNFKKHIEYRLWGEGAYHEKNRCDPTVRGLERSGEDQYCDDQLANLRKENVIVRINKKIFKKRGNIIIM